MKPHAAFRPFPGSLTPGAASLYGRDIEHSQILGCLERACAHQPQLLLISGPSGIGKTALVHHACNPVRKQKGFFASSKFDPIRIGASCNAWAQMLDTLVNTILARTTTEQVRWQQHFEQILGNQADHLLALVPALATLVPKARATRVTTPASEQVLRLHEAFTGFFRVFSKMECPVVLFIDDVQWIDPDSLDLLRQLLKSRQRLPLLLICAYRNTEMPPEHIFHQTLDSIDHGSDWVRSTLELPPLGVADIERMLADTLHCPLSNAAILAKEVHQLSRGNPFYVHQMLQSARARYTLHTAPPAALPNDNLTTSSHVAPTPPEVRYLIQRRFHDLPELTRTLLSWAACLGQRFDADTLLVIMSGDSMQARQALARAIDEGYLQRVINGQGISMLYRFTHDKLQELAYSALSDEQRAGHHQRIARMLQRHAHGTPQAASPTTIADHMNRAPQAEPGSAAALEAAHINLLAARHAKMNAAFTSGLGYAQQARRLVSERCWDTQPELSFHIYCEQAELDQLNGNFERAEDTLRHAARRESNIQRKAMLYNRLVTLYTLAARYTHAIDAARQGLALFGTVLPTNNLESHRHQLFEETRSMLRSLKLSDLGQQPRTQDPAALSVQMLLTSLAPACYRAHPTLWTLVVLMQLKENLTHGMSIYASYTLPAFGGLLSHETPDAGRQCADLFKATEDLVAGAPAGQDHSVAYLMIGSSLRHWFAPLRQASADYLKAYQSGEASGNLQYSVYGFGHNTYCRFFQGTALNALLPEVNGYLGYCTQRGNRWGIDLTTGALRVLHLLHGPFTDIHVHANLNEAETDFMARCHHNGNLQVLCIYHIMRALALLLLERLEEAHACIQAAEELIDTVAVQGLFPSTQFYLLRALISARLEPASCSVKHLDDALIRFAAWERHAPWNFASATLLLRGEQARLHGRTRDMLQFYAKALQEARAQKNPITRMLVTRSAIQGIQGLEADILPAVYVHELTQAAREHHSEAISSHWTRTHSTGLATLAAAQPPWMQAAEQAERLARHTSLPGLARELAGLAMGCSGIARAVVLFTHENVLHVFADSLVPDTVHATGISCPVHDWPAPLPRDTIERVYTCSLDDERPHDDEVRVYQPIRGHDTLYGVLYLERTPEKNLPDQRPVLAFLAQQTGLACRTLQLRQELGWSTRNRQSIEQKIQNADTEIAMRRGLEERLKTLLNTDPLTELPNRRAFFEHLAARSADLSVTQNIPYSVLMIDIDHFKQINDIHGHAMGDLVLRHLAGIFRQILRKDELPARLGGEEFALILPDTPAPAAGQIASRLCDAVRSSPIRHDGHILHFTISVGLAQHQPHECTLESTLKRADQALYSAKANGRDQLCWST